MLLKSLTQTSVDGTGTLTVESMIFGGALITTDNSNVGTVVLQRDDSNGKELMKIATATSMWINGPFSMESTNKLYFNVTGTACKVYLYEWVN